MNGMYVATLVANKTKGNLEQKVIHAIAGLLGGEEVKVIEKGRVSEVFFSQSLPVEWATIGAPYEIDVLISPVATRKKKLLVCDMESTIVENEFLDEIASVLGVGEKVAQITERAMNGLLNFEEALEERINIVAGMPEAEVRDLIRTRLQYSEGAKELLRACRKAGIYTMLVSGGFTLFTGHVMDELGFDEHQANDLIFQGEKLSGVGKPILGKNAKWEYLRKKSAELGIGLEWTAAAGDGANDLPMLKNAGFGLAYKAKPIVKEQIKNQVNFSDLEALAFAIA